MLPESTLLTTKLYRPPAAVTGVARPELLARLQQDLTCKLILVSAPAGFGKTTLVSQWLGDFGLSRASFNPKSKIGNPKSCWLSLDEADNDPALFLRYVVAALRTHFPAAGANTLLLSSLLQLPPAPHLAATLLGDLVALPEECVLVLDDYHCITQAVIHQLLTRVLEHLPPHIHLCLISRIEPPLPLARLRVQQQLCEIRAADLCFSDAETQTFLAQALERTPDAATVAALQMQTEGWITGLQLATLSLRRGADEAAFVKAFAGSNRYVMDYLMEEVFRRQSPAVQLFLVRTASLNRFCAPLCAAIMGDAPLPSDSLCAAQAMIVDLTQANLFLIPLDDRGEWYRYHHLFQEMLRRRLPDTASPAEIAALHRQASVWLAQHGWIEEALQQALAGGDALAAAQLVEQHWHAVLNRQDLPTLKRWLALLPPELAQRRPALLIAQAWLANAQGRMAEIPPLAQQAEAGLASVAAELDEQAEQLLRADLDAVRMLAAFAQAYTPADSPPLLEAARRALSSTPVAHTYIYSSIMICTGYGYLLGGQPQQALRFLQEKLEQTPHQTDLFRVRLLFMVSLIQLHTGHLSESLQTLRGWITIAARNDFAFDLGWAYRLLGLIHYEWNELAEAQRHFAALVELGPAASAFAVLDGRFGLALIQQAQGQAEQAQAQVDSAFALSAALRQDGQQNEIRSFQAHLLLCQGDIAAATRQMERVTLLHPPGLMNKVEIPHLTQARLLIAQASAASLQAAGALLHELQAAAETHHNGWRMVEILALKALMHQAQGQSEQALATLVRAMALAKAGGFIRTWVDLGPPMARLLYQLAARGVETDYLGRVLAAFPPVADAADAAQHIRRAAQAHLIEPLTERESEILLHLQQARPNKAIARALNISALTVKKHTIHLYQKLGVQSRQQAVARARALGILPPNGDPTTNEAMAR
jgi:LuxR family maltose regulon positive regulatory protein